MRNDQSLETKVPISPESKGSLLSGTDANHERANALFRSYAPPFRTSEAVLVEASHLLSKDDPAGPADIVRLGAGGLFEVVLRVNEHWLAIERMLRKYVDLSAAFGDACLIRCAEIHDEPRILTFDEDSRVYRWGVESSSQRHHILVSPFVLSECGVDPITSWGCAVERARPRWTLLLQSVWSYPQYDRRLSLFCFFAEFSD